jgi:hypothetical protein
MDERVESALQSRSVFWREVMLQMVLYDPLNDFDVVRVHREKSTVCLSLSGRSIVAAQQQTAFSEDALDRRTSLMLHCEALQMSQLDVRSFKSQWSFGLAPMTLSLSLGFD